MTTTKKAKQTLVIPASMRQPVIHSQSSGEKVQSDLSSQEMQSAEPRLKQPQTKSHPTLWYSMRPATREFRVVR